MNFSTAKVICTWLIISLTMVFSHKLKSAHLDQPNSHEEDSWFEPYQWASSPEELAIVNAVAMLLPARDLKKSILLNNTYEIQWEFIGQRASSKYSLCPNSKISDQPAPGFCSGFLLSQNTLATAGHCIPTDLDCQYTAVVFTGSNFGKTSKLLDNQVYKCDKILHKQVDPVSGIDLAIIQLERPVVNRNPLKFNISEISKPTDELLIVGHPLGIPLKILTGGSFLGHYPPSYFRLQIPAARGLAGAPVINRVNQKVEGMLVRGQTGLEYDSELKCNFLKSCSHGKCQKEEAIYATNLLPFISNPKHSLYIANATARDGEGSEQKYIFPGETVSISFEIFNQSASDIDNMQLSLISQSRPGSGISVLVDKVIVNEPVKGKSSKIIDGFSIKLADSAPCTGDFNFVAHARTLTGESLRKFSLPIGEPIFHKFEAFLEDDVIPDFDFPGLLVPINVNLAPNGRPVFFEIEVDHPRISELRIDAQAPDSTNGIIYYKGRGITEGEDLLYNMGKLSGVFGLTIDSYQDLGRFSKVSKPGKWVLNVADLSKGNVGRVKNIAILIGDKTCH